MNKTENMATMLLTLTQSDEWFRLCDNDEGIRETDDHLQAILDNLAADNPDEMMEQVWDAVCRINNACCAAAMLYGIRIANTIRDVSVSVSVFAPNEFSAQSRICYKNFKTKS